MFDMKKKDDALQENVVIAESNVNICDKTPGTDNRLDSFLNPKYVEQTESVKVSERLPEFIIRSMMQEEMAKIAESCTTRVVRDGQAYETFDRISFNAKLVRASVVDPDCSLKVICDRYGTTDPNQVLPKMLFSGEFNVLQAAVMKLNKFKRVEKLEEEAKNS